MIFVTRKVHFNAAHKLYNPNWTSEKNEAVFGKCANQNWHGHNFDLFVTVKGAIDPETGYVIDLSELKKILQEKILNKLDHKNLNLDVDFMQNKLASTENLAIGIWNEIAPILKTERYELHSVKLFETERNFVEYFGN